MLRGLLSVVLLVTVFVVALVLTGIASYLAEETASVLGTETRVFWRVATPLLTAAVFLVALALVYRLVPARFVPWHVVAFPAVTIGMLLAGVTQLFTYVAPRLIGAAAVYGTFVAIFALMIWLSVLFQGLLIGAAWVGVRLERDPPTA
jgi:membrane protein